MPAKLSSRNYGIMLKPDRMKDYPEDFGSG